MYFYFVVVRNGKEMCGMRDGDYGIEGKFEWE